MRRGVGVAATHALFYLTLLVQARLCFNFMLAPRTTNSQCRIFSGDAMGGSQVPRSEIPDRFDTCLVFISGVIGTEPAECYLANGHYVLNFALAIKGHFAPVHDWEKYKPTEVMWVRVELWDEEALKHSQSLAKGQTLSGLGHLVLNKWVDKVTGEDRKQFKVRFTKVLPSSAELDAMLQSIGLEPSEALFNARGGSAAGAADSGFSSQFPDDSDQETEFREFKQAPTVSADSYGTDNTNSYTGSDSYTGSNSYSTAKSNINDAVAVPNVKKWFKAPAGTSFGFSNSKSNSKSNSNSISDSSIGNRSSNAMYDLSPPRQQQQQQQQQWREDERHSAELDDDKAPVLPSVKSWKPRAGSGSSIASSSSSETSGINSSINSGSSCSSGSSERISMGAESGEPEPGAHEPEPELTWDLVEQNIDALWSGGD